MLGLWLAIHNRWSYLRTDLAQELSEATYELNQDNNEFYGYDENEEGAEEEYLERDSEIAAECGCCVLDIEEISEEEIGEG